jgi:histidyl-tRNA synthetase
MGLITKVPVGLADKLPAEAHKWHTVERVTRAIAERCGFKEIGTPTYEHTELFLRGVGSTTDVVQKEMYTFEDKGGRSITLKPEGTSPVVRAAIENGLLNDALPLKVFYFTSCFRHEKPQKGRLREHHQFGCEVFGSYSPQADVELICLAADCIAALGIPDVMLELNSIGCKHCRAKYTEALKAYFEPIKDELCDTCKQRLERNPMRLLDCKSEHCRRLNRNAPVITDYLCGDCSAHFERVKRGLQAANVNFKLNPRIVRGLDYYTQTVFEFVPGKAGSQTTICAGGRYNGLVEEIGGNPTAGLGFGMGIERIILTMEEAGAAFDPPKTTDIYIAGMDDASREKAAALTLELRRKGLTAQGDLMNRSLKAQMKYADKIGAAFCLVIGGDELAGNSGTLRFMPEKGRDIVCELTADSIAQAIFERKGCGE